MTNSNIDRNLFSQYLYLGDLMRLVPQSAKTKAIPEIGSTQTLILQIVNAQNTITQKELVTKLDMRPQSTSELLQRLEKKGLITRTSSKTDKRVMVITLTADGKKIATEDAGFMDKFFAALDPAEAQTLLTLLTKVVQDLEQKVPTKPSRHFD